MPRMGIERPDDYARELGLDFLAEEPAQSNMGVLRFTFRFPADEKSTEYAETVARVTLWSKKMKPWTFVHPGPLPIVAAELTFGNRWRVGVVNRKTKKLMAAFWTDEAQARRLAMSQPTPQQSLKVLSEQVPKPKEKATKELIRALTASIEVLSKAEPVIPSVSQYAYEPPVQGPVFGDSQGTESVH